MKDIFTIDPGVVYDFYLVGGLKVSGPVIQGAPNGLVLIDGTHIVQEHIIMFKPQYDENSGQ